MKCKKKHFCEIVKEHSNGEKIIFKIKLKNNKYVYMKIEKTPYVNNERFVVFICTRKLLKSIDQNLNKYHSDFKDLDEKNWLKSNQSKYEYAKEAFSKGIDSPVPLARVGYLEFSVQTKNTNKTTNYIVFNDGITRTIWLFKNNALCFPVECFAKKNAKFLNENFGVDKSKIFSVEKLTKQIYISKRHYLFDLFVKLKYSIFYK